MEAEYYEEAGAGLTLHFSHDEVKVLWELMVYSGCSSHLRHTHLNHQISSATEKYMKEHGIEIK
jgi:hypothetical protein